MGYDLRLFISRCGDDSDYVEGFVEGCLERIRETEEDGLTHPDDVTAGQFESSWQEPGFTEEKRDLMLKPLLSEHGALADGLATLGVIRSLATFFF